MSKYGRRWEAARPSERLREVEAASIVAAHPLETGRHDLYQEAMRLVGERHEKGDLVDLVNWLLYCLDRCATLHAAQSSSAAGDKP